MTTMRSHRRKPKRMKCANEFLPSPVDPLIISAVNALPEGIVKYDYLKSVLLSKYVSSDTAPSGVRRQRAIEKWLSVERSNSETNERIPCIMGEFNILPRVSYERFIARARGYVSRVLPDVVPFEALFGGFSGGASTSRARTESHPALKYVGKADITSSATPWFNSVREELCLWNIIAPDFALNEVRGNHMFTVPKSSDIDRVAAKEPDLNMYLQRGIGSFIRSGLRRQGIDLNDQSINNRLAREGSLTGRLATLDLSSASDSMTIECVAALVPDLWFSCLMDLRSSETLIEGEWHRNEMLSSMGNGFTFELESLIFWALSKAASYYSGCHDVVSVYGDDIIVESDAFDNTVYVLKTFGFTVNPKKSFSTGPFRESCGGHYSDGYDITPFFLREPIKRVRDVIIIANQIRKWSTEPNLGCCDPSLESLWLTLKGLIPKCLWGGVDLESDQQLVSDDVSSMKLVELTKDHENGAGGYLLWLNSTWRSIDDATRGVVPAYLTKEAGIMSSRSTPTGRFRLRRSKGETRRRAALFSHELGVSTSIPSK